EELTIGWAHLEVLVEPRVHVDAGLEVALERVPRDAPDVILVGANERVRHQREVAAAAVRTLGAVVIEPALAIEIVELLVVEVREHLVAELAGGGEIRVLLAGEPDIELRLDRARHDADLGVATFAVRDRDLLAAPQLLHGLDLL